jgi:TolC family type I secretion outer membrane protein
MRLELRASCAAIALSLALGVACSARAETLTEAFSQAYQYNPALTAQRAKLRSTDEGVPQALSGWRPTVQFTGAAGLGTIDTHPPTSGVLQTRQYLQPRALDLNVTQPIFTSGRTQGLVRQAEHNVLAQRAQTIVVEEQTLFSVAQAYLDVVLAQAIVELNINNEQVLRRQLQVTSDQFRVGQGTRTDVAQAESRLALATADRVQSEGNLQAARANYVRAVGHPPGKLTAPKERPRLPATLEEAVGLAGNNNPNVIFADYSAKAGEDNVRATRGLLGPQLSIVGDLNKQIEVVANGHDSTEASVVARVTVPLYEAGSVYAQTRAAKQTVSQLRDQLLDSRHAAVQQATRDWEQILALKQRIVSLNSTIRAAAIALDGVRQEEQAGTRTVLDVLNAQQELLTDQVNLVTTQHDLAITEFDLAQQIGTLTALELKLPVELYDVDKHYKEVRDKWFGFGSNDSKQ